MDRLQHENHDEIHEFFTDLTESRGVRLIDMNYLKFRYLPRTAEDYMDSDGHMQENLAQRQAELLKEITFADDESVYFEDNYESVLQGIEEYQGAA